MTKTKKNIFKVLLSFLAVFAFTFLFTVSVVFAADKKIEGLDEHIKNGLVTVYKNEVNDGNKITDLSKIEENTKIIIKLGDLKDKEVKTFKIGDKEAKFDDKNQYIIEKLENDLKFELSFANKKASPEKQSLPATTIAAIVILVIAILVPAIMAIVKKIEVKKAEKDVLKDAKDLDSKSAETKAETETEEKASEETKEETKEEK